MEIGIGYLGLTEEQFWDFTPRLLQIKMEGFARLQEQIQREEWERMRFQTVALINKDRKRKDQVKMSQLITFPWEKKVNDKDKIEEEKKRVQYLMSKEW
tara:strand:- start:2462 stop:2758 length:297 start_codon:yes stop_codon:yes gene_type:complete